MESPNPKETLSMDSPKPKRAPRKRKVKQVLSPSFLRQFPMELPPRRRPKS